MVSDHRAFFIEKREVNDKKKLKGEDLWNNDWVLYGLPCFPNRNQPFFKKKKKDEIQVGLTTRDLLWFILPKEEV